MEVSRSVQFHVLRLDATLIGVWRRRIGALLDALLLGGETSANDLLVGIVNRLRPALLVPLLYHLPQVWTGQTPGHRLMGVRLGQPSRLQAAIRYLLMVMLPTLLAEGLPLPGFFQRALERLSLALRIFDLFHYVLWFLGRGGPMSLVDRLLGVQTVYIHSAPSLGPRNYTSLQREMQARALGQALMLARPLVRVVHRKVRTFFRLRRLQELEKSKNVAVDGKKPLQCVECEGVAILPVLVPPPSSGRPSISSRTKEDCTAAPPLVFCLYCFQQVREDYGLPAAEAGEEGVKYLFLPPAKD